MSKASDASSAAAAASNTASQAYDKASAASVAAGKGSDASSKIAAQSATWNKGSDASSKIANNSATWSADGSNALSKITARSATWDKASAASSAVIVAQSKASDASSAAVVAQSKASDASSAAAAASDAASNAQSKITARSAVWDKKCVVLKVLAEGSSVASGDDAMRFAVPNLLSGMNLVSCGAHVYTAPTSNSLALDIYNITSAADMLTSAMKIDQGEKDTTTATSQAVIDTSNDGVAAGEELRVDVTSVGSGAAGLEVRLTFEKP